MDTEAIASEIVRIRSRLAEIDEESDDRADGETDDERTRLRDRLGHLQSLLSAGGPDPAAEQDSRAQPDPVTYVRPA